MSWPTGWTHPPWSTQKILIISGQATGKRTRLGDFPRSIVYDLLETGRLIGPHSRGGGELGITQTRQCIITSSYYAVTAACTQIDNHMCPSPQEVLLDLGTRTQNWLGAGKVVTRPSILQPQHRCRVWQRDCPGSLLALKGQQDVPHHSCHHLGDEN